MKAEEVVSLLQARLPLFTSAFSDSTPVVSIINTSGNTALVTTSTPHNLTTGDHTLIKGAQSDISITSLTRTGIVGELVTNSDHDVTLGLETIEISGAVEAEFNGTFNISKVLNRRTIQFIMPDAGATTATGSPLLVDGESIFRGYSGLQIVTTVPTTTTFTYGLISSGLLPATGTITIEGGIRISAGGTLERLVDAYDKQGQDKNWMFVVLGDVTASKSRQIESDGVDNLMRAQQGEDFRQQIIQPVTVYIFIPTTTTLAARQARDEAEDLFPAICGSILFFDFNAQLASPGKRALMFVNHGFQGYNSAYYIHQYTFEQMVDLTFGDTVGRDADTAFRDISLIMNQTTGSETFTAEINLDEEALP